MRLYKENKVNPAAGCLPLLVQLPILILLFNVLRTYDFAGTSFMGIILGSSTTAGLAQAVGVAADPTGNYGVMSVLTGILKNPAGLSNAGLYIGNLILLISISFLTWAQQKLSSGTNPQMAMMNTIMPFFMAFICLSMPGGVMLYWGLSSLMGVVQQYFVMSKTKQELQVKPALHKNKPTSSTAEEDVDEYEDDDYEEDDDE
jgi:YidC/Oxa1 family membrane protein insertase